MTGTGGVQGARRPGRRLRRGVPPLLIATCAAVALWAGGVAILVAQRVSGGPTYTYWLETTFGPAIIIPIALLLVVRRPEHRLSRLYTAFIVPPAAQLFTGTAATALQASAPASAAWFAVAHEAMQMGFVLLLLTLVLLYPTGRLPGRQWRFVGWCLFGGAAAAVASNALTPQMGNFPNLPNPLAISAGATDLIGKASWLLAVGVAGAVLAPVIRYRRADGIERLQLKWFTFTVVTGIVVLLSTVSLPESVLGSVLWTIVPAAVPASIGLAVVRYRLLEIDRIISRTVSYAVVSALLVGLYGIAIVVLTPVLAGLGGGSTMGVAAATLLVAAAFRPVRRRVQSAIDRRFDRGRYDAARTVEAFAGGLRSEVDIEQLSDRLVEVVGGTVAPSQVSLWLADPDGRAS